METVLIELLKGAPSAVVLLVFLWKIEPKRFMEVMRILRERDVRTMLTEQNNQRVISRLVAVVVQEKATDREGVNRILQAVAEADLEEATVQEKQRRRLRL